MQLFGGSVKNDTVLRSLLSEMRQLLADDRSPLCATMPKSVLDHSIQKHLTHFSLVTHGFGSPAIQASISALMNWVNESLKLLDSGGGGSGGGMD